MAPTTLLGQRQVQALMEETLPMMVPHSHGRDVSTLEGSAFVARVAVNNPANLMKAKRAIRKAFQMQIEEMGFSFVEILLACPTNWG